jgi:hypothetical protein
MYYGWVAPLLVHLSQQLQQSDEKFFPLHILRNDKRLPVTAIAVV